MADDYQFAQVKVEVAEAEYNSASQALKVARIHKRLAEIKSQYEPLNSLIGKTPEFWSVEEAKKNEELREKLYAAAFYVVIGRMP